MPLKKSSQNKTRLKLRKLTGTPVSSELCTKGALILKHAHDSASALFKAFELTREERGGRPRGMTTDEEQDLLRAMLIMAAAGLDAMVKQLVRDSLPSLTETNKSVREKVEEFVLRRTRGSTDNPDRLSGAKFLARVLSAPQQQGQVIEEYIQDLTKGSLQSLEELMRTATALGLLPNSVGIDPKLLNPIFEIRTKIIHELDINLDAKRRNRNIRKRTTMMKHTNTLLQVAEKMLRGVDAELTHSG